MIKMSMGACAKPASRLQRAPCVSNASCHSPVSVLAPGGTLSFNAIALRLGHARGLAHLPVVDMPMFCIIM